MRGDCGLNFEQEAAEHGAVGIVACGQGEPVIFFVKGENAMLKGSGKRTFNAQRPTFKCCSTLPKPKRQTGRP